MLKLTKLLGIANLKIYEHIPSIAWWLMLGAGIFNLLTFACLPFLAIILARQETKPLYIGIVLGVGPLIGMIVGFIGASLSDYYGRRIIILLSLYLFSFAYMLFSFTTNIIAYMLISALLGLSQSLFEPTTQALLSDMIPAEKIKTIFKLRYLILNIGFAFGPLLGACLALISEKSSFILAAIFSVIYSIVIMRKTRNLAISINTAKRNTHFFRKTLSILIIDKLLLKFLFGAICVAITYSQFESTIPQYIFSHGLSNFNYAYLLMINAFGVLVFQMPVSKIADRFELLAGMRIGSILLFFGYLIIAISNANFSLMILGMSVITFGELFISPVQNTVVKNMAGSDNYGLYFGVFNLRQIGFSLGPIIGSYLLSIVGGAICFLGVAIFGIAAAYFFGAVRSELTIQMILSEFKT